MREAINDDGRLSTAIRGKSHLSDANPHQWPSTAIPTNLTFQMQALINGHQRPSRRISPFRCKPSSMAINGHPNLTFQMQALIIHLFIAHTADHVHTFLFERLTVDPTCGLAQAATVLALLSL